MYKSADGARAVRYIRSACIWQRSASKENRERITRLGCAGMGGLQTQVDDIVIRQDRRLVAVKGSGPKTAVFKTEYEKWIIETG